MIKSFFKEVIQKHKFLFLIFMISFISSLFYVYYGYKHLYADRYISLFFFIPTIILLVIDIIAVYMHRYVPRLTNFIILIVNFFIIIIIYIFIGFFFLSFIPIYNWDYIKNKPEFYSTILTYFPLEQVSHFPLKIPKNATNVEINAEAFTFFGSQILLIKFNTNKKYIEKELKKYHFKYKEDYNHYIFKTMTNNEKINISDFTFYVIDGKLNRYGQNYGIGVNKDFNQIIYYYSNPD